MDFVPQVFARFVCVKYSLPSNAWIKSFHFSCQLPLATHFSFMTRIFWGILSNTEVKYHPDILWVTSCAYHRCQWKGSSTSSFWVGQALSLLLQNRSARKSQCCCFTGRDSISCQRAWNWSEEFCIWVSALGMLTVCHWGICLADPKPVSASLTWGSMNHNNEELWPLWKWLGVHVNDKDAHLLFITFFCSVKKVLNCENV